MKKFLLNGLFVLAMIPLVASADIRSDMQNGEMTLAQVVNNALDEGMSISEIVSEMISIDSSQSSAIVATAMILQPDSYESIISSAIDAEVDPSDVLEIALAASDEENAQNIIDATMRSTPANQRGELQQTAQRLTQTGATAARRVARGQLVSATTLSASGGGSASTAETVDQILAASAQFQATLAQVEQALAAAGFTADEITTAVDQITSSLAAAQSTVDTAIAALNNLQQQATAPGATLEDVIAGINDAIASVSGDSSTS